MWELWNGDTADPAMNSGNHVMLVGDLVVWLYEYLAGIRPDEAEPGFKHIIMRPEIVPGLERRHGTHQSPYGLIESHWQRNGSALAWNITVPVALMPQFTCPRRMRSRSRSWAIHRRLCGPRSFATSKIARCIPWNRASTRLRRKCNVQARCATPPCA